MEQNKKPSFYKTLIYIVKENFLAICITLVIITSFICSLSSLVISKKTASQVETLSYDYLLFSDKIRTQLESIQDNVDFLRDWATDSPSLTLGDTYVYHNIDEKNNKTKMSNR